MENPRITQFGFVPVEEIQNVFSEELTNLEEDLKKNGIPGDRMSIIDLVDDIRLKLIKRANHNIQAYISNNPRTKAVEKEKREAEEAPKNEMQKAWQERVQANKRDAIRDSLRG